VHTTSTGYAGLLAAMLHQRKEYPIILSEHGIYTKERNIELLQSKMIIGLDALASNRKDFTYQHELWIRFFDSLARMCYHYADSIISLYPSAQNLQIVGGADINKTKIIPNGVDIAKFAAARRPVEAAIPKIVGFVGRFVRIKDIRTFIRAVGNMVSKDDDIIAWIKVVGEADIEYKQECIDYIHLLNLEDKIKFIPEGDMLYVLSHIGLLIMSSISEGMPLVLLESLAAGVPVISTDVGSCRVIIEGHSDADKQLGSCGHVVPIGDALMLAEVAVTYLNDSALWHKASQTGITRVEQFYNQSMMIGAYHEIYQKAIFEWQG
jgi:polysaccharide biosynthesis protein PelF